jgi:nucleoside-diphosphate-sugar epimerase
MKIGITGATGYVGIFISNYLIERGHSIRAWRRPGSDTQILPKEIDWRLCSLSGPQGWDSFLEGLDAVVHGAFDHIPGKYRGGEGSNLNGFIRNNLSHSIQFIQSAYLSGIDKFIFLSSRAAYGKRIQGINLDENHPARPDTHYGAYKAAIDHFVQSFGYGKDWDIKSLRLTGVFGIHPHIQKSKWYELIKAVVNGKLIDQVRGGTEVHGREVARAIDFLLRQENPGEIFNLGDTYITTRNIVQRVYDILQLDGFLPEEPPQYEEESIKMDCRKISDLGFQDSSKELFRDTIQALVEGD